MPWWGRWPTSSSATRSRLASPYGPAINGLAFGAKLWRLKPPWRADYSSVPAFAAFQRADPGARACVQRAGDVLFVPNNWGHAVLNLETAVGVAAELTFLD